jgi:hypothetical protein
LIRLNDLPYHNAFSGKKRIVKIAGVDKVKSGFRSTDGDGEKTTQDSQEGIGSWFHPESVENKQQAAEKEK